MFTSLAVTLILCPFIK